MRKNFYIEVNVKNVRKVINIFCSFHNSKDYHFYESFENHLKLFKNHFKDIFKHSFLGKYHFFSKNI